MEVIKFGLIMLGIKRYLYLSAASDLVEEASDSALATVVTTSGPSTITYKASVPSTGTYYWKVVVTDGYASTTTAESTFLVVK